jgi:hypothetical protein
MTETAQKSGKIQKMLMKIWCRKSKIPLCYIIRLKSELIRYEKRLLCPAKLTNRAFYIRFWLERYRLMGTGQTR